MTFFSYREQGDVQVALLRLRRECKLMHDNPPPNISAVPNLKTFWNGTFSFAGSKDRRTKAENHGKLVFPEDYPHKPPSIYMITPNGRFLTDTRLCLSMSDFHPETWTPTWTVSTILTGVHAFMLETTQTVGSVDTTDYTKRAFARKSHEFNDRNAVFLEMFPDEVVTHATPSPSTLALDVLVVALCMASTMLFACAHGGGRSADFVLAA